MGHQTPLYEDLESRLGESLAAYVSGRREAGRSWRRIALEITARTGVDITGEVLRVWFVVRRVDDEAVA